MTSKLTTSQAAARLGVTRQTLYAYVSRGVLRRTLAEDGRSSLFEAKDIEAMARRGRPRRHDGGTAGRIHVSMASAITEIREQRIYYRGQDSLGLAEGTAFERVAVLLWTGALPLEQRFVLGEPAPKVALAVMRALPVGVPASERFATVTGALACERPLRADLRAETVAQHGGELIAALVASLPLQAAQPVADSSVAAQLWCRLSPLRPTHACTAALNGALVLLADHELATSTLAARVAASTRADPLGAVMAGFATASGPLHGKAANQVHRLLLDGERESAVLTQVVLRALQEQPQQGLAGFGHPLYPEGDPRAAALLGMLPRRGQRLDLVQRVREIVENQLGAPANVDFALGALAYCGAMPVGSTEAIFVLARVAGWIAHALEEYGEAPLRFRGRATYEGRLAKR